MVLLDVFFVGFALTSREQKGNSSISHGKPTATKHISEISEEHLQEIVHEMDPKPMFAPLASTTRTERVSVAFL